MKSDLFPLAGRSAQLSAGCVCSYLFVMEKVLTSVQTGSTISHNSFSFAILFMVALLVKKMKSQLFYICLLPGRKNRRNRMNRSTLTERRSTKQKKKCASKNVFASKWQIFVFEVNFFFIFTLYRLTLFPFMI